MSNFIHVQVPTWHIPAPIRTHNSNPVIPATRRIIVSSQYMNSWTREYYTDNNPQQPDDEEQDDDSLPALLPATFVFSNAPATTPNGSNPQDPQTTVAGFRILRPTNNNTIVNNNGESGESDEESLPSLVSRAYFDSSDEED